MPKDSLWDLSDVIYPLRTRDGTLWLIRESESCSTKAKAYDVLLNQSIRNIPVCMCMEGWQVSDFHPRTHSSIISASILLSTTHSVQMSSTRLSKASGANIYGKWSNQDIYHLQNFKSWMTSRSICLGIIPLLTSGFLASKCFLHFLIYTTLQMGYQTCQALLQKNRALFFV